MRFPVPVVAMMAAAALAVTSLAATPAAAQMPGPLPVTVAPPLVKKIIEWDEFTGRFEAQERVEIRARVSGYLDSVHFKDGQVVQKGDLLFVVDPRPYQAQLDQAKANLDAAKTRVALAQREFKRAESLLKRNNISHEVFDQREAELETSRTSVEAAQAMVRTAALNLGYTQIKAPVTGRVSDSRLDVGNLIEGGGTQSKVLTTIVSTDPIRFTFSLSEAEYLKYEHLRQGQEGGREAPVPVQIRLMDEDTFRWKGHLRFIDNELSADTGTIRAQAEVPNPSGFLTPGLFGRLRMPGTPEYLATLVPDDAVVSDQSRKLLLTVDKTNTVKAVVVKLGPIVDGLRVIHGGITGDDLIIVNGVLRARPGGKVVPMRATIQPDGKIVPDAAPPQAGAAAKPRS